MLAAMHAPPREKSRRMRAMRKQVREHDIDTWATGFLDDLDAPTP
jgi:trehalose 6-phosphate synthase